MERCRKNESIETLYMKTEFLNKPRVTPILEGKYRMQGPIDEHHYLSSLEGPFDAVLSSDSFKDQEHFVEDQCSKRGRTTSGPLEVHLDNPKQNQADENPLTPDRSYSGSTNHLKTPTTSPLKVRSETHAGQHGNKCRAKLPEEKVSNILIKPLEGTSVSDDFLKQNFLTLKENNGMPSTTHSEEDVKVCDICGDAGYEDLLAVCNACNEGAEHIYCMRIRLMALPEGNWCCEICKGKDEIGDLSGNSCTQVSTLREASASEMGCREKKSEKHFLPPPQEKREAPDYKEAALLSNFFPEGNNLINLGMGAVDAPSSNKQINEKAGYFQSACNQQTHGQGCMLKGNRSGRSKSTVHFAGSQLATLPPPIRVSALERLDSQTSSSKAKFNAKETTSVLTTVEFSQKKLSAFTIPPDITVPKLKRQALEHGDNKLGNGPSMNRPEKTSENLLKISETSKGTSLPQAIQGKEPIGRSASWSSIHSRGNLEVNTSSTIRADLEIPANVKDPNITYLSTKVGNVVQEKSCSPSEVRRLSLQSNDNPDISIDLTDIKSSRGEADLKSVSQGLVFSGTKSIWSNENIADENTHVPPGESRKASQELPYSFSSHLGLSFSHAFAPGNAPMISQGISSPLPTRCYRCKETGHSAKDCSRSLFNHGPDLLPNVSWVTTALQNDTVNNSSGIEEGNAPCGSFTRESSPREPFSSRLARPQHTILWQGGFEVLAEGQSSFYYGIQAHPSTMAVKEVYEATRKLPNQVSLEEVQANFVPNMPDGGLIALFFKSANADGAGSYLRLLEHMTTSDLVLRGLTRSAELLVFTSSRLPQNEQCWNQEKFLWGLFRKRKFPTPRSIGILNPWHCQSSIPSTSYYTREDKESYSGFNPVVSAEHNYPSQAREIDTLAAKKLDAANPVVNMSGMDLRKGVVSSSRMTAFPYIQELKPALQTEHSILSQGFSDENTSKGVVKRSAILPYGFATVPLNCTQSSADNLRTELESSMFLPSFQTLAGSPIDKSNSQRNWMKKNYLQGAGKNPKQKLHFSNLGFGSQSVFPASERQTNESFLPPQLSHAFPNRLESDLWDNESHYAPHYSIPSNINAGGRLRGPYVESNFDVQEKEGNADYFATDGETKASTILHTAEQVLEESLRTREEKVVKELHKSQEDLQELLERHEYGHVALQSLEYPITCSGSQSHSSSHSRSKPRSPFRVNRSSSASLSQCGTPSHPCQQNLSSFLQSDFGEASKSSHFTSTGVSGKRNGEEPSKLMSIAQFNPIEELYLHFVNEKTMHGDACKDMVVFTEDLLQAQTLHSEKSTSATKLGSRQDFKEQNYEVDSAESSISSGELFEQKFAVDEIPRFAHSSVSISTSSSLIQSDVVINTGKIRENLEGDNHIIGYASSCPSDNREVPSIQSEAYMSLNLELGLGAKCSKPQQEPHLLEQLSGFESTLNCVSSISKWVHADFAKSRLLDPEHDSNHCNYAGPKDQSTFLTLATPSQGKEPFSSGASEEVGIAECTLQLLKG